MERKLYKKELALWKEVTKEDIKINKYTSEELTEDFKSSIEKRPKALKKKIKVKKEEDSLNIKEKLFENNKESHIVTEKDVKSKQKELTDLENSNNHIGEFIDNI